MWFFFDDKPIVLKGDIYEEGRNYSDYRKEYDSKPKRDPQLVEAKLTELKRSFSGRIEKRKSEIEKDLKSHRAKINQRIQKTLKEKISILNMDLLTIILVLLATTTALQIITIAYLLWRK